jgi:hypothetical protein
MHAKYKTPAYRKNTVKYNGLKFGIVAKNVANECGVAR